MFEPSCDDSITAVMITMQLSCCYKSGHGAAYDAGFFSTSLVKEPLPDSLQENSWLLFKSKTFNFANWCPLQLAVRMMTAFKMSNFLKL